MVAADVMMAGHLNGRMNLVPVEDWWIHPSLVEERKAMLIAQTIRMNSMLEMLEAIGTNMAEAGGAK
jgi:hypothetical protein